MSREEIEQVLHDYLGAQVVVWLPTGWSQSRDTDGHVDGIAMFTEPGRVLLLAPADPSDPDHDLGRANAEVLTSTRDAEGRSIEVTRFDPGSPVDVPYLNVYLANGATIAPLGGTPEDEVALAALREALPGREVVPVPGAVLHEGGGGPHCITQQIPAGSALA
jgi:agmatine deiminase